MLIGIPVEEQCLSFNGQCMEDDQFLTYYHIKDKSVLVLHRVSDMSKDHISLKVDRQVKEDFDWDELPWKKRKVSV